jgi:hypothetical protein
MREVLLLRFRELIRWDEKAGLRGMRYAPNVDVLKAQ